MSLPRIVLVALEDYAACAMREALSESDRDPKLAASAARCAAECLDTLYHESLEALRDRKRAQGELEAWADNHERANPDDARIVRETVANARKLLEAMQ